jgi:hypothetical protein
LHLPGICAALGLTVNGQMQRIKRTSSLVKGLRRIPLQTRGGTQAINCLRVDRVALWLAGVETSRGKPTSRAKIEAYQDELAPVAMRVFLRVAGLRTQPLIPTDADPQITAIAEQIETLTDIVTFLREHMEALMAASGQQATRLDAARRGSTRLDQTLSLLAGLATRQEATESQVAQLEARTDHLTPAHARTLQEAVDRLARATKHLPSPLTHAIIYGRLKPHVRVGSLSAPSVRCPMRASLTS